jgi:HPt (histidine-containing phosphotransfer) domain-containing protein
MEIKTPVERIDLMDVQKSMERFGGNEEIFLRIMRSFVNSTYSLLSVINNASKDNMAQYAIAVHGLKGASRSICAYKVGDLAEALEKAAKTEDFDFIRDHNPGLLAIVDELIAYINEIIDKISSKNSKNGKDTPDIKTLSALLAACKNYDMDGVDAAMADLESFEYKSGSELIAWLRTNVDLMNLKQIEEKLSNLDGVVEG